MPGAIVACLDRASIAALPTLFQDRVFVMRRLGLAILLASGGLIGVAQAGQYGCQDDGTGQSSNHNAQDPTKPGTIGGCGTGQYKLDQFNDQQKQQEYQQQINGPKQTGSGQNL